MRVICIDAAGVTKIKEGQTYTVIEERDISPHGHFYMLSEVVDEFCQWWFSDYHFIPLTGDEAPELEEVVEEAQPVLKLKPGTPIISIEEGMKLMEQGFLKRVIERRLDEIGRSLEDKCLTLFFHH